MTGWWPGQHTGTSRCCTSAARCDAAVAAERRRWQQHVQQRLHLAQHLQGPSKLQVVYWRQQWFLFAAVFLPQSVFATETVVAGSGSRASVAVLWLRAWHSIRWCAATALLLHLHVAPLYLAQA